MIKSAIFFGKAFHSHEKTDNDLSEREAHKRGDTIVVRPRVQPHGIADACLSLLLILPFQISILFLPFGLVTYLFTESLEKTALAIVIAVIVFSLFSVSKLTLSTEGIRFHRILGSPQFIPWEKIRSVHQVTRKELIIFGWLWPPFPAREMSASLSSIGHYRIEWETGFCYFPPANVVEFEADIHRFIGTGHHSPKRNEAESSTP